MGVSAILVKDAPFNMQPKISHLSQRSNPTAALPDSIVLFRTDPFWNLLFEIRCKPCGSHVPLVDQVGGGADAACAWGAD